MNLIEGKVINSVPALGNVALFMQNKLGIILTLVILFIYISHTEKVRKKKQERRLKRLQHEEQKNVH